MLSQSARRRGSLFRDSHGADLGDCMPVLFRRVAAALFASLAVASGSAAAQSVSGSLSGTVVDQTRQVLQGATVTLSSDATGDKRVTVTNQAGLFAFAAVQPGIYTVR